MISAQSEISLALAEPSYRKGVDVYMGVDFGIGEKIEAPKMCTQVEGTPATSTLSPTTIF